MVESRLVMVGSWWKKCVITLVASATPMLLVWSTFEYFGHKRMGFMRYLVFMKNELALTYLSPSSLVIIKAILFIGTLVTLVWALKSRPRPNPILLTLFLTQGTAIDFILSDAFETLNAAPFILAAFGLSTIVQYFVLIIQCKRKKIRAPQNNL